MSRLAEVYAKHSAPYNFGDKGTAHNYLPTYERFLDRTEGVTLLEIGVLFGHSIAMWEEYLTDSTVIGLDLDISQLWFLPERVYQCDGTDTAAVEALLPGMTFDYVVDDGSHRVEDQIAALDVFLPRLKQDGRMFVEDIAGDDALAAIREYLGNRYMTYHVYDGRGPDRPPDEIMVVVRAKT
jgi:cyclopropane fatty-acyl-phospholipid synthase-like methyltransferase